MLSDMNPTSRGLLNQQEIVEEYITALEDLKANSKPVINFLTLLAEDNIVFAPAIVDAVEGHLKKVQSDVKLPVLYLIDSIIKNVKKSYVHLFARNIENVFCDVFRKVDENTRQKLFKLRQTWKEIFGTTKLHSLDVSVQRIDKNWPVVNLPHAQNSITASKSIIHVNPKFLSRQQQALEPVVENETTESDGNAMSEEQMREELLKKQQELNDLKKQKIKLAMLQQQQMKSEKFEIPVQPILTTFDDSLKSITVPSDVPKSLDKRELSPTLSENQLTLTDDALERELLEIQNGGKIIEDPPMEIPAPAPFVPEHEEKVTSIAFLSAELVEESSLVSASSLNNSHDDDILKLEMELSMIINDNKIHDNERSQRSSSSSQKTIKPPDEARPKNSSERSPSKSSSVRVSSSSSLSSSKQQQQQPQQPQQQQQQQSSSSSEPSRTSRSKSSSSSSRRKKSSKSSSRKRSRSPHHHSSHHHHRERHHHHHHATRHRERHHTTPPKLGLDEEEQLGGSLIVSPPQPLANVKHPQQQQSSSSRRNNAGGRRSRKDKSNTRSPSPIDNEASKISLRRDSASSRDEDLRATLTASTISCTANIAVKLDSKEDLDLRVLPMTANKRASSERLMSPLIKKSKNDDFDVLFGKEDVDLRILNPPPKALTQPPTPPPPVISDSKDSWAKFKTPSKSESSRSDSRNSERSATERSGRDRSSRNKFHNKQSDSNDSKDRRRSGNRDYDRNPDRNIEIIMKQAAEQLNQGTITKSQYNKLIQEVFHMSEDQKLRAAQRKDRETKIWDRNEKGLRGKDHGMHPRIPGPRWQQPWHQPWAHPPGPFQGPFRPEFRPMGPWQNHPRMFGSPVRPDFHQFHGNCFNPRVAHSPIGPNGPMMLPNGPMKSMSGGINSLKGPIGPTPTPPNVMMPNMGTSLPKRISSGDSSSPDNSNWPSSPFNDAKSDAEVSSSCNDDLPPADPKLLEDISKDTMRSINIDNIPREIRFYGETGVIFMHWDDPRDIGFQNGARRVYIDGKEAVVCSFNDDYREFTYDGEIHRIKLGAPTRELFIDGNWYQCYFGGQPVTVDLGNKKVSVKLEGPPPQVKVGNVKRTDLVLGKINVIINARNMVPVFLDAKPQTFNIDEKPCTIEFMDALMTVLLNGRPFDVEFGGLPMPVMIYGKKHFIRFSVLPRGFRAGYVNITHMKGEKPRELPPDNLKKDQMEVTSTTPAVVSSPAEPDSTSQDAMEISYNVKSDIQLDVLSSVVPSAMAPSSGLSYQAEPVDNPTTAPFTLPLNLNELFQRLVETGIVTTLGEVKKEKEEEEKKEPEVISASFDKPETLKIKQPTMVTALYSGIQCSSCGARFAPEMATRYSHHLDWHFRQNRKERDSSRKAHSRLWYYDVSDWIQFEEIEDLEDRAQSWFETEKQTMETENAAAEELYAETMQPSVPTGSDEDAFCQVCHEAFEQFYNDEKEEWHLRPAITFEDKNFHPVCLEDHKRLAETAGFADIPEGLEENKENNADFENTEKQESASEMNESDTEKILENETLENVNETETEAMESSATVDSQIEESTSETHVEQEDTKAEETCASESINDSEMPENNESKTEESVDIVENNQVDTEVSNELPNCEASQHAELEPEPEECPAESPIVDSTQVEVKSTIDGNVELESTLPSIPVTQSKIIINITKPLNSPKESADAKEEKVSEEEALEPEPEPLQPASIKLALQDRNLSVLPPVEKGEELSGLCSIM